LRYTLNAFAIIKERTGINLFDAEEGTVTKAMTDPSVIRTLVFAGLVHEDPELTEQQVGEMIDLENLGAVSERFVEALAVSQKGALGPPKGRRTTTSP
jgi:hypothetical protein